MAFEEQSMFARQWDALRKNIWLIAAIILGCTLLAILATLPRTPMYQGRAKLEMQGLNDDFLNLHAMNPNASSSSSASAAETYMQTQIEILQSESLIERVILKLNLTKAPEFVKPRGLDKVTALWGYRGEPTVAMVLPKIVGNLHIRPTRQTSIVELTYDSADPKTAAAFVNTLIDEYVEQDLRARWNQTQRTREWLAVQLADTKKQLERSEKELQAYGQGAGLLFTGETNNVSDEKLRQVQAELSKVQADRMAQESLFNMATTHSPESLPAVLDNGPLREYQLRLADLRRQRADLSSTLTPSNYRVQRLDAQISELETTLKREQNNVVGRIRNEYEAAEEREKLLAAAYGQQAQIVSQQANKAIRYNTLKREVDTNRGLYEMMLHKVSDAGVASAVHAASVRVVDPAKPPLTPYKPQRVLSAGLGLLAGIIFAVSFVAVREGTNRTFQLPGRARTYLNIPELGVVPSLSTHSVQMSSRAKARTVQLKAIYSSSPNDTSEDLDLERLELAALTPQAQAMGDSFRAIVTSILFSSRTAPQIIVLTSPTPGDGKTTMVSNLSIVLAQIGHRVLVVDADSRRPSFHKIFQANQSPGLSDYLNDPRAIPGDLASIIQPTRIPGLSVLTAGSECDDLATALFSKKTSQLLRQAKNTFDTILIDTPPMLLMPDARIIGRLADAVILVFRANRTTKDDALTCADRLSEDQTPLLGTILNDWKVNPAKYGYYSNRAITAKAV